MITRCPTTRIISALLLLVTASCATVTNYPDPHGPRQISLSQSGPSSFNDTLKIVTYNIKRGEHLESAVYELTHLEPLKNFDVLLLQEMDGDGVAILADRLGLNYVYYPAVVHFKRETDFGNAILSPWPLEDPHKIILPHLDPMRKQQRIAVLAIARIGDYNVLCSSVHTEMYRLGFDKRLDQIDSLASSMDEEAPYALVGGDFNPVRGSTLRAYQEPLAKAGLALATADVGWTTASGPFGVIKFSMDHIFVRGMRVLETGVCTQATASDHRPVWVLATLQ